MYTQTPKISAMPGYEPSKWLSSICKPPKYADAVLTYFKGKATYQGNSVYTSNITEKYYLWNYGNEPFLVTNK